MPVDVLVPPLGTNVDTLTLVSWYRQEGETVQKGEPLFAVETDKAVLDVEAPETGVLRQVACLPGTEVTCLTRIAVIATSEESRTMPAAGPAAARPANRSEQAERGQPDFQRAPSGSAGERIFISPRAKRLAEEQGVAWRTLRGTGPEGAIVERDVHAALDSASPPAITPLARRIAAEKDVDWTQLTGTGAGGKVVREDILRALGPPTEESAAVPAEEDVAEKIPLAGVRGLIADRMVRSATETAPVTLTSEIDATALVDLRVSLKADGVPVSYNDLFLYILARALREHPRMNASLQAETIAVWKRVHIGLAVDSERGLLVPVVRDVDRKGLAEIARETAALIEAAREGKIPPEALRGSTFTLTNLGMYAIDAFTPIINLPECAILGVGRIRPQPTVVGDQIAVRQCVWLSLTFDHRLVDGGPAARFLQRVSQLIAKPHLLLS
ncbi:MAG TPA: 2-oxo acid dehydrogenase subunit E2 [Chthonomonadaceae bacterium]|nr:2-oxo acid dehydrogenase subunit E2 [Chthonomonadaceae bacterium]